MSRVSSPTIVFGLGSFGAEVVARLRPLQTAQTLLLEGQSDGDPVERVLAAAERLLGLAGLLSSRAPGDDRRPALDVFIVADLGEADACSAVPDLIQRVGARLRARYSHIFSAHDQPNLTLSPVLGLSGSRSGRAPAEAAAALTRIEADAFAPAPSQQHPSALVPRVFVVEQQTSRYELSLSELSSTVVSFLSLMLRGSLRQEQPIRDFLRSPPGELRDRRLFASFGCATLELTLGQYCVAKSAADLVEGMLDVPAAGAASGAARASRLVTSAEDLEAAIVKHESGEDLIELLRAQAPHVSFPGISERDTPEQIRDQSYGWGFYESLEQTVDALVRRLDDLEMDELSRVADERGLTHSRKLLADARAALFELERSGPHGWGLALRLAEQVHAQSSRQTERLSKKLRTERLPPFPKPDQVESAFRGLREESTLRPRPYRLVAFGVLAAAVATALCAFLPKWIVVALLWRKVPLLSLAPSASSIRVTGPLAYVVEAPWVYLWLFCLFGAAIGFWLARHKKKRHEALLAARDDLRAAVGRFLSDAIEPSILRYYEARLAFVMRAWALRALSRLRDATSRDVDRLTGIGAALSRLRREFEGEASRMASESAGGEGGDLLYRTRASSELMASTYEAMRPPPDLAQKLFEQSLSEDRADAEDAPSYLLPDNVLAAVRPHVEPSSEVLGEHAGPFVVEFVRELSGKLGVPLEISGFDERTAEREYLFAPEWALAALGEAKQAARSLPQALAHGDPDRVHLVTVRTALTRESIVVLGEGKS